MKYVMSDIHGDYERYIETLGLINFSESDVLFVLGDVIDRGAHGIKILQHMMQHSNIVPLLGNHELMAYKELKFLSREITEESLRNLMKKDYSRCWHGCVMEENLPSESFEPFR